MKIISTLGLPSKKFPAINRRIEILGAMDDRHKEALEAADALALIELAQEYAGIGCPTIANQIMIESEGIGVIA